MLKLLAAAALILAITAVAALTTKLVGHHTTCTTKSQGAFGGYGGTDVTSCTTSRGLW